MFLSVRTLWLIIFLETPLDVSLQPHTGQYRSVLLSLMVTVIDPSSLLDVSNRSTLFRLILNIFIIKLFNFDYSFLFTSQKPYRNNDTQQRSKKGHIQKRMWPQTATFFLKDKPQPRAISKSLFLFAGSGSVVKSSDDHFFFFRKELCKGGWNMKKNLFVFAVEVSG